MILKLMLLNSSFINLVELFKNIDFEKNYSQEYKIIENIIYKFNKKNV